jgi:hypothetical protein
MPELGIGDAVLLHTRYTGNEFHPTISSEVHSSFVNRMMEYQSGRVSVYSNNFASSSPTGRAEDTCSLVAPISASRHELYASTSLGETTYKRSDSERRMLCLIPNLTPDIISILTGMRLFDAVIIDTAVHDKP